MPYAHPESLLTTEKLAARIAAQPVDPSLRVVDATFTMPGVTPTAAEIYRSAHLPGASWFDIDRVADPDATLPHMLPDEDRFAECVASLGIGNDSDVVVYDGPGMFSAGRVWWMFRAYGHRRVAVLDGGLRKWRAEGRPVEAGTPTVARAAYCARFAPELLRTRAQLIENLSSHREQLLDARAQGRFEASAPETWPGRRAGHVPGSLNLPFDAVSDPATGRMLPAEELERRFAAAGFARSRPVVTSCGSGVTACALSFALHLIGIENVALYDGSWAEWGLPGETPVATGPARAP